MSAPDRPSLRHARRVRTLYAAITVLTLATTAIFAVTGGLNLLRERHQEPYTGPTPWDFTVTTWDATLGGDKELTDATYQQLATWHDPKLGDETAAQLQTLARDVARADLTAPNPARWPGYWPTPTTRTSTAQCTDVDILATSPAALPVSATSGTYTSFAKILVAYSGGCTAGQRTTTAPGITYVYAGKAKDHWQPLRSWQVPASAAVDATIGATEPYTWELAEIDTACTDGVVVRARIAVAAAFEQMCAAAADANVTLKAASGYRTRAEQASLFADAVRYYGTTQAARKHVAYADQDVCDSKHCSGLAVNVAPTPATLTWLAATVACIDAAGTLTASTTCPDGSTPVPQASRWGFAAPLTGVAGYLEFTLPLAEGASSSLGAPDCSPTGIPVANMVASIFRCRLARDGVVGAQQDTVVAQALVVSRCESGWNASAAAYGGRYATTQNPADGRIYDQRGVFMLSAALADAWVAGGRAASSDPVANINAAASLWLTTHGWEQFGCATGAAGGFEAGPVLPQYGGPALPAWATTF